MKILFTGGGTGGHFYPIIAVAQEINNIAREQKLLAPDLYYMAPDPYDSKRLLENNITFKKSPAGKMRRYFSLLNILDFFKTVVGVIKAVFQVFFLMPDVIFCKGGYASFPTVFAARVFRIPLVVHESDSRPGKVNKYAGKFARRIAVSYPDAAKYFPEKRVALTGNPVRREIYSLANEGAHEFLHLEEGVPVILILGGSQGSQVINDAILNALPKLIDRFQIIHQVGTHNFENVKTTAAIILDGHEKKDRYKAFDYLNDLALRMAAGVSEVIISRAGSTIFEIALWKKPSIIIPIPEEISHDQHSNAFTYARSGAAVVIEEKNLTPNILAAEVERINSDEELKANMRQGAASYAFPDAAYKIARAILEIALSHETR